MAKKKQTKKPVKLKKKHIKQIKKVPIPLLLVLGVLIIGIAVVWFFYGDKIIAFLTPEKTPIVYSSDQNEEGYYYYSSVEQGDYYYSANNKAGTSLKETLHTIITKDFVGISYADARYILEKADEHPTKKGYLYTIYDDESDGYEENIWNGNTLNREHVWPNSYLGVERVGDHQKNIASDLHNLRMIRSSINSSRSNRFFDEGSSNRRETLENNAFYPGIDHRGDVARIMFYMVTMYPQLSLSNTVEDILKGEAYTDSMLTMGKLDVLLQWHKEDPVDDFERNRNTIIYEHQGNRNPYIDKPEYVHLIFEAKTIDELTKQEETVIVHFFYKRKSFYQ